jgi:hypothetical protein
MTTEHGATQGGTHTEKDKATESVGTLTPQAGSNPGTIDKPKTDKSLGGTPVGAEADSGSDPGTSDIGKNDSKSLP